MSGGGRVGQARRRDANEPAIVGALQAVGCDVTKISGKGAPDLLVRLRGRLWGFEVKSTAGTRTAAQETSKWPILRTVDDAIAAVTK